MGARALGRDDSTASSTMLSSKRHRFPAVMFMLTVEHWHDSLGPVGAARGPTQISCTLLKCAAGLASKLHAVRDSRGRSRGGVLRGGIVQATPSRCRCPGLGRPPAQGDAMPAVHVPWAWDRGGL